MGVARHGSESNVHDAGLLGRGAAVHLILHGVTHLARRHTGQIHVRPYTLHAS